MQLFWPADAQIVREKIRIAEESMKDAMEEGSLQNLRETDTLLPIRKETAALTHTLPDSVMLANSLARPKRRCIPNVFREGRRGGGEEGRRGGGEEGRRGGGEEGRRGGGEEGRRGGEERGEGYAEWRSRLEIFH